MYVLMTSVGVVSKMKEEWVLHELINSEDEIVPSGQVREVFSPFGKSNSPESSTPLSLFPPLLPNQIKTISTSPPFRPDDKVNSVI